MIKEKKPSIRQTGYGGKEAPKEIKPKGKLTGYCKKNI